MYIRCLGVKVPVLPGRLLRGRNEVARRVFARGSVAAAVSSSRNVVDAKCNKKPAAQTAAVHSAEDYTVHSEERVTFESAE